MMEVWANSGCIVRWTYKPLLLKNSRMMASCYWRM